MNETIKVLFASFLWRLCTVETHFGWDSIATTQKLMYDELIGGDTNDAHSTIKVSGMWRNWQTHQT